MNSLATKMEGNSTKGTSAARFAIALKALDRWVEETGKHIPSLGEERTFAETELRAWLDGGETPLDWTHALGTSEYPRVTADEWFFITTLYGTMTLAGQRTHIRKFYPTLFVEAAGRDMRNFHPKMAAYAGLRQNWMKTRLTKMGQILSSRGKTMTEYVEELRALERGATPGHSMPARDRIFSDHQSGSGKTLSVFVRDCVLGNCFPIDSRVRAQLTTFGLPNHEEDEEWLVDRCLEAGRNPRQIARLFYDAGGAVMVDGKGEPAQEAADEAPDANEESIVDLKIPSMSGDEAQELNDEDEAILDRVWAQIAAESKTARNMAGKASSAVSANLDLLADDVLLFSNGDDAYLRWLTVHPYGYVVNCYRNQSPEYMVLHKATCGFVSRYARNAQPGAFTERNFVKVCSENVSILRAWANSNGRQNGSFTGNCPCIRSG